MTVATLTHTTVRLKEKRVGGLLWWSKLDGGLQFIEFGAYWLIPAIFLIVLARWLVVTIGQLPVPITLKVFIDH